MSTDQRVKLSTDIDEWPEGIPSQEVLWEMRRAGLPKPSDVPETLWNNIQKVNYNHENIADLMLTGHTKKEVAEKLGMALGAIYLVTRTPTFKAYYRERRKGREEIISRDGIMELLEPAVDTVAEIMQDPNAKESTRLSAAQFIIEQSVGKAKQEVKQETSVLVDFMARIEQLQSRPPEQQPKFLDKPKDKFDTFIDVLDSSSTNNFEEVTHGEEPESEP